MKLIKLIIVQILITFIFLEISSRVLVKDVNGQVFLLGKKWRYILPFNYFNDEANSDVYKYGTYDSLLGWSINKLAKEGIYMSNSLGLRCSEKQYLLDSITEKSYTYLAIGNSFTHGDAVEYEDTWVSLLSQKLGSEIGNLGVGGYGIDQAVLRLMNVGINADTVFFGLVAGDLERAITPIYNFYNGGIKSKPMFQFDNQGYTLKNVPCIKPNQFLEQRGISDSKAANLFQMIPGSKSQLWLENSWIKHSMAFRVLYSTWHKMNYRSEKPIYISPQTKYYNYCLEIFNVFNNYCIERNIHPIVIFIDEANSLNNRIQSKNDESTWKMLKTDLEKMHITVFEFQNEALQEHQIGNLIHKEEKVHLSPEGNNLYAKGIYRKIHSM
jgi:hypothetical protein